MIGTVPTSSFCAYARFVEGESVCRKFPKTPYFAGLVKGSSRWTAGIPSKSRS